MGDRLGQSGAGREHPYDRPIDVSGDDPLTSTYLPGRGQHSGHRLPGPPRPLPEPVRLEPGGAMIAFGTAALAPFGGEGGSGERRAPPSSGSMACLCRRTAPEGVGNQSAGPR